MPLIMCVLLVHLTTLFVDGFGFEHNLDASGIEGFGV